MATIIPRNSSAVSGAADDIASITASTTVAKPAGKPVTTPKPQGPGSASSSNASRVAMKMLFRNAVGSFSPAEFTQQLRTNPRKTIMSVLRVDANQPAAGLRNLTPSEMDQVIAAANIRKSNGELMTTRELTELATSIRSASDTPLPGPLVKVKKLADDSMDEVQRTGPPELQRASFGSLVVAAGVTISTIMSIIAMWPTVRDTVAGWFNGGTTGPNSTNPTVAPQSTSTETSTEQETDENQAWFALPGSSESMKTGSLSRDRERLSWMMRTAAGMGLRLTWNDADQLSAELAMLRMLLAIPKEEVSYWTGIKPS